MNRNHLESLTRSGHLRREGLEFALAESGILPNAAAWRRFIDRSLLCAGTLLVLSGIIFFFAFNWDALHRLAKIGLVLLPLVVAALSSLYFDAASLARKAWLSAAVVLIGALLAVQGQIYQTGVDIEWLFFGWALLALPWVLSARVAWLWVFWLILLNAGIGFALETNLSPWFSLHNNPLLIFIALNALALALWEGAAHHVGMRNRHVSSVINAFIALPVSAMGCLAWWDKMPYAALVYVAWLGATLWFYQTQRRHIVPLALLGLSVIVVGSSGLIHILSRARYSANEGGFLLVGLLIMGLTTAVAMYLRHISESWKWNGDEHE